MGSDAEEAFVCSILLPTNRGMPYLPEAIRGLLSQEVEGRLEIVVACDGDDEDWQFLLELVQEMGAEHTAVVEVVRSEKQTVDGDLLPAWVPEENPGIENQESKQVQVQSSYLALTAAEVASVSTDSHFLRIVRYADGKNRGQGAAMSLALSQSSGDIVGHMEADDVRPRKDVVAAALKALDDHADWQGVASEAICFGPGATPRMMAYCEWQNSLLTPEAMRSGRFIEMPALHQTSFFRRSVIDTVLSSDTIERKGCYRDGVAPPDNDLDTPVDLWWWLAFFHLGFRCGRIVGCPHSHADLLLGHPSLHLEVPVSTYFGWRQHPAQRTRSQGRLSVANLRRIKIYWLLLDLKQRKMNKEKNKLVIMLLSVGATLDAWCRDLREAATKIEALRDLKVLPLEWRPSKRAPPPRPYLPEEASRSRTFLTEDNNVSFTLLRLFAYGDARVRGRIKGQVDDWDSDWDIFVA